MNESQKINPDVKIIEYGKKVLKNLTIYPLSAGDQFTITDIITKVAQELVSAQQAGKTSDYSFMLSVMGVIKINIGEILSLIIDPEEAKSEDVINDLTNSQLVDIADIIWSVNYEPALKKGQSLFERGKKVFGSSQSLQSSSNTTLNTDLKTSIESPIEKED
jgi:hypothetical protein